MFPQDEDEEMHEIPVGFIVFCVLNRVNRIRDDGYIDFSEYIKNTEQLIEYHPYDKKAWDEYYNKLIDLIEQKSEMASPEKYRMYKIYNQFAYFLLNGYDFDEWICFANTCEHSGEIINSNYKLSDVIEWRGFIADKDGTPYIGYWVNGFEYLFMLDLWELLYNSNIDIKIKKCQYCCDFFITNVNQRKYCFECDKQSNKIKNEKQKSFESNRWNKKIRDILYKRNETGSVYRDFLNESQYYRDRLKGKPIEVNPNYKKILTEEEYIQWLKEYHEQILIRKRAKHGETNETCERNGSNHEGIGQTQEALSSDDHPWME